ncbi:MAG: SufS family cysteine desulfurase [Caldithrix sp.]|nr:SufS family cysteine desulfurase [Caldithrix sp.]
MALEVLEKKRQINYGEGINRDDFPILLETIRNHPVVYFDNAATTQKPKQVIDALVKYYEHDNANVHRAIHQLGERATAGFEKARNKVAEFINAHSDKEIIFTRGTTEAINLVATSWGRKFVESGDEIILSEMEHHSNLIPWQLLAKERGAHLRFIPFKEDGTIDYNEFIKLMNKNTKLIAITHMSNVFGTINPFKKIIRTAHDWGVPVLLDAAQSVPHLPVDVQQLDCDFLAFSGHKMLGPTGIGVLYAKTQLLENMDPYQGGGEMINTVWLEKATWNEIPHKFEAGTPNIAGAIGLAEAIDYLQDLTMETLTLYEQDITTYALEKMMALDGITIYGQAPERGGVVSFNLENVHPHDLAHFLDQHGIAVRAGHHCAQPIMRKLEIASTTRASFYFYNTYEEIDYFIDKLQEAAKFFAF